MNEVQPIRDKRKISSMKKYLSGRNKLIFVLGINLGLRISDLLALKVSDFYEENGRFKKHLIVVEQKTGKARRLALSTAVKREIKEQGIEYSDTAYMFPSRKGGKPIGRVQAYRILNEAAAKAGISEIGTHTLRKTFGHHAYKAGTPLTTLQSVFGHSSEKHTMRYIGITQDNIDDVYIKLNL
jgi:integrase